MTNYYILWMFGWMWLFGIKKFDKDDNWIFLKDFVYSGITSWLIITIVMVLSKLNGY